MRTLNYIFSVVSIVLGIALVLFMLIQYAKCLTLFHLFVIYIRLALELEKVSKLLLRASAQHEQG